MINREFNLEDGRVLNYHEYSESVIDIEGGKIQYLTRSCETENAQDFVVLYVELTFEEWSPDLISYETAIEAVTNGELKVHGVLAPVAKTFSDLQREKSTELSSACRLTICKGYESAALGQVHTYPANNTDQANMTASVTDSLIPENPAGWLTAFWCADADGVWALRPHTAQQIRKAGADMKAHVTANILKNAQLQERVKVATSTEELDLIVWE